jgi:hypothetical protein
MVRYRLAQPVADNKTALRSKFPNAPYKGDIGDPAHLSRAGDHTPYSADRIFGLRHQRGVVYAQDVGNGGKLHIVDFTRYVLDQLRAGRYPEVKYIISRHPGNKGAGGGKYYGLFDRRYSWRPQKSSGHDSHVHISYMPGFEDRHSNLVDDYRDVLDGNAPAVSGPPVLRKWKDAPPLPMTPLRRYSHVPLSRLPCIAYPPMVRGYGGPDSPAAQSDFVAAIMDYARRHCRTIMIPPEEVKRAEFGPGFLGWARMVALKAGNGWINDPIANGKAFGAAVGAPLHW